MNTPKRLKHVRAGLILTFDEWVEEYAAKQDNWDTTDPKSLVQCDVILKILVVVDED